MKDDCFIIYYNHRSQYKLARTPLPKKSRQKVHIFQFRSAFGLRKNTPYMSSCSIDTNNGWKVAKNENSRPSSACLRRILRQEPLSRSKPTIKRWWRSTEALKKSSKSPSKSGGYLIKWSKSLINQSLLTLLINKTRDAFVKKIRAHRSFINPFLSRTFR